MPLFEWEDKYSVGNTTMDNHHKKLFDIINGLHEAMKEGKGEEVIEDSLKELHSYTTYHFNEEEKLMALAAYPGIGAQKSAHREFLQKIEEYQQEVAKGNGLYVVTNVTMTTKDWLKSHILTMDMQYESYMKGM